MGEKERGMAMADADVAREAATGTASGRESSAPSVSEKSMAADDWTATRLAATGDVDGDGLPDPAEATNLNSSKSNIYREAGAGGGPEPAESTNLNSSRSNIYRQAAPGTGEADEPAGFAINEPGVHREATGGGRGPEPAEATNLNSSRSNIYREAGPVDDGEPEATEGTIVKSKSNITNNREADPGGGEAGIAIGDPGVNSNLAEPAGLAVSDEGAPGSKPTKKN